MNNNSTKLVPVIHLKEWVIANIISYIPVIGLTMLFIWAFGSSTVNENKKNWAKALLLIQLIAITLIVLFYILLGTLALVTHNQ